MINLTWEQKLKALNNLTPTEVKFRAPGDWYCYCSGGMSICNGSICSSSYGNGATPEEAVNECFKLYSEITLDNFYKTKEKDKRKYIKVYGSSGDSDRYYFWDDFMWKEVKQDFLKTWYEQMKKINKVYRVTGDISLPIDTTIEADSAREAIDEAIAIALQCPKYILRESIEAEEVDG